MKGVQSSGEHMLLSLLSATLCSNVWRLTCELSPRVGAGEGEREVGLWIINYKCSRQLFFYSFFALFRMYL